jgi:hypothetical protein
MVLRDSFRTSRTISRRVETPVGPVCRDRGSVLILGPEILLEARATKNGRASALGERPDDMCRDLQKSVEILPQTNSADRFARSVAASNLPPCVKLASQDQHRQAPCFRTLAVPQLPSLLVWKEPTTSPNRSRSVYWIWMALIFGRSADPCMNWIVTVPFVTVTGKV